MITIVITMTKLMITMITMVLMVINVVKLKPTGSDM